MPRIPITSPDDEKVWKAYYLGAFVALKITHLAMGDELARATRSGAEALHVIATLRDGREGDRVGPALAWLRVQRQKEAKGDT